MTQRQPWPWEEDQSTPVASDGDPTRYVAMPDEGNRSPAVITEGEFDCRHTIDKVRADHIAHGASPEWADKTARKAAHSWDRGVRTGSIKLK